MEQIELVVKMPRHAFDEIKKKDSVLNVYLSHVECMHDAIKNGVPLATLIDKILSEKSTIQFDDYHTQNEWDNWNNALDESVRIIKDSVESDKEGAEE